MKVMFVSKTGFNQHPLAVLYGWAPLPHNDFMAVSLKPFVVEYGDSAGVELLVKIVKAYKPDVLMVAAFATELVEPSLWKCLDKVKSKKVIWSIDDPFKIWEYTDRQAAIASHFDYVVTCHRSESTYDFYKRIVKDVIFAVPVAAKYLIDAAGTVSDKSIPDNKRVVVYGNATYHGEKHSKRCVLSRIDIINQVMRDGLCDKVEVYGRKQFIEEIKKSTDQSHKVVYNHSLNYNELHKLKGSIIINPHVADPGGDYLNARFFEACAIGSPQIIEYKDCVIEMLDLIEDCDQERADFEKCLYAVGDMSAFKQALSHAYNLPKDRYASLCQYVQRLARLWTGKEFMEKVVRGIEAGDGSEYFGPMIRKGN